mmetsp:Transcript_10574/g.28135  ORF Transcript_10574/g.28135 Transcript_10574/m.28135 type:complete len:294 (-) Transcript_10574:790-1671(-)
MKPTRMAARKNTAHRRSNYYKGREEYNSITLAQLPRHVPRLPSFIRHCAPLHCCKHDRPAARLARGRGIIAARAPAAQVPTALERVMAECHPAGLTNHISDEWRPARGGGLRCTSSAARVPRSPYLEAAVGSRRRATINSNAHRPAANSLSRAEPDVARAHAEGVKRVRHLRSRVLVSAEGAKRAPSPLALLAHPNIVARHPLQLLLPALPRRRVALRVALLIAQRQNLPKWPLVLPVANTVPPRKAFHPVLLDGLGGAVGVSPGNRAVPRAPRVHPWVLTRRWVAALRRDVR